MLHTNLTLFVLVNLAVCIYYLARSIWKSMRRGEFAVGKPPRK
jgi:hypothetical protein